MPSIYCTKSSPPIDKHTLSSFCTNLIAVAYVTPVYQFLSTALAMCSSFKKRFCGIGKLLAELLFPKEKDNYCGCYIESIQTFDLYGQYCQE